VEDLQGRVAVITGGGGGIGEGIAQACAAARMKVVVADIAVPDAERVAAELRRGGAEALAVACDVSERASVEALAKRVRRVFGAVHLLCNNAGVLLRGPLVERSEADWEWVIGVNLRGVANGVAAFVPHMQAQGGPAHIVNTASIGGLVGLPGYGVYSATKSAVVSLSEVLREEVSACGIGVSVLCPGGVATRVTRSARNRPDALGGAGESDDAASAPDGAASDGAVGSGTSEVLSAREVGRLVLLGVRANDPFIATHPAWGEAVAARNEVVLASFDTCARRRAATG